MTDRPHWNHTHSCSKSFYGQLGYHEHLFGTDAELNRILGPMAKREVFTACELFDCLKRLYHWPDSLVCSNNAMHTLAQSFAWHRDFARVIWDGPAEYLADKCTFSAYEVFLLFYKIRFGEWLQATPAQEVIPPIVAKRLTATEIRAMQAPARRKHVLRDKYLGVWPEAKTTKEVTVQTSTTQQAPDPRKPIFNPGDQVICIRDDCYKARIRIGARYTIKETYFCGRHEYVDIDEAGRGWDVSRFVRVAHAQPSVSHVPTNNGWKPVKTAPRDDASILKDYCKQDVILGTKTGRHPAEAIAKGPVSWEAAGGMDQDEDQSSFECEPPPPRVSDAHVFAAIGNLHHRSDGKPQEYEGDLAISGNRKR